jgi:hypothetical protein
MTHVTELACACRRVRLEAEREPIIAAECHCDSCRVAGARLATLRGAARVLEPNGGTRFVLYRKDRIRFLEGDGLLKEHRLTPRSSTRRVIATCCNTPVFLEFKGGHWLSLYAGLWPEGTQPPMALRTMTSDLAPGTALDDDIPNARRQSFSFFAKLFGAWVAMGFRNPKLDIVQGGAIQV